uniref:Uncharacterized protein n=1 Tax=Arundo donax TaxID=35708 RepID=A0A0A9EVJ5_ARUDO
MHISSLCVITWVATAFSNIKKMKECFSDINKHLKTKSRLIIIIVNKARAEGGPGGSFGGGVTHKKNTMH